MAADHPQDISDAELAVLQLLWDRPALSTRQIAEALHSAQADARYPTVQKQLERLEAKGFVKRDRSLMVHLFSAAVGREELVGRRLDAVVDTLCGGSVAPAITHLLRATHLSDAERDALRALIDQIGGPPSAAAAAAKRKRPK